MRISMSSNKKKKVDVMETDPTNSSSDDSSDGDNDEPHPDAYTGNEEVQVDFEGRSPIDSDSHGISQLLQRLFLKANINTGQMAELICGQNYVGSVIYQSEVDEEDDMEDMCEDDTIFGITTVINITEKKDVPCIEQLRSYIVEKAEKFGTDSVVTHIRDVLSNPSRTVGFLINERFINIPAQISIPLFESLTKEIHQANKKKMPFDFIYFMMIIKFYRKEAKKNKPSEDFYTNAEEEMFASKAVNSFEFSVAKECDTGLGGDWLEDDPTLIPYRKIILFDAKELPHIIDDIKKALNQGQV